MGRGLGPKAHETWQPLAGLRRAGCLRTLRHPPGDSLAAVLELDGDGLVLDPVAQQWLYFDAAHGEWRDSGIVPGEAVFVSLGGILGVKRALREDEVVLGLEERIERIGSRVVGAIDGELIGPIDLARAQALAAERAGASLHVWSTRAPRWTSV